MTMHKHTLRSILLLLTMLPLTSNAIAAQQEGIVFDPQSGNYTITYENEGQLLQTTYEPPNKINPLLRSAFRLGASGDVTYRYRLENGKDSRQNIVSFAVLVTSAKGARISTNSPEYLQRQPTAETALALNADSRRVIVETPSGWNGSAVPEFKRTGLSVDWFFLRHKTADGLPPGRSQGGFGYESRDLPGVGLAGIRGATPTLSFEGDGPSQALEDQLSAIRREVGGVSRPAAVPTFSVSRPFDAATLLAQLQKHAKVDLVEFKLIDPVLAAQLDRWFTTAIDAAKHSNNEGMHHAVKELRRLLRQECADMDMDKDAELSDRELQDDEDREKPCQGRIDKLAARVLDFDLRYVESRIQGRIRDD